MNIKIKKQILIIFITAFLLRVIILFLADGFHPEEYKSRFYASDAKSYFVLASNIYNYGEYSLSESHPYIPDNIITPLYPVFLVLIFFISGGPSFLPVLIIQILISCFTAILIYFLSHNILEFYKLNIPNASLISALVFTIEPMSSYLTVVTMTETVFLLILVLILIFILKIFKNPGKIMNWLILGLLMGLNILTRPIFIPVSIAIIIFLSYFLIKKKLFRKSLYKFLLLAVVILIILTPWMIRNKITFGNYEITHSGAFSVYVRQVALIESKERNITYKQALDSLRNLIPGGIGKMTPEYKRNFNNAVKEYILQHPIEFSKSVSTTMFITLFQPGTDMFEALFNFKVEKRKDLMAEVQEKGIFEIIEKYFNNSIFTIIHYILFFTYIFFLYSGLILSFFNKKIFKSDLFIISVICSFIFLLFSSLLFGGTRYRIPTLVLIIPFSCISWALIIHNFKIRKKTKKNTQIPKNKK